MKALKSLTLVATMSLCAPVAKAVPVQPKDDDPISETNSNEVADFDRSSPIVTDRPGNGNAATTVAAENFQLESSLLFARDAPVTTLSAPTLVRYGLASWAELRAASAVLGGQWTGGEVQARSTDAMFGAKFQLWHARDWLPNLASSFDLFAPVGTGAFSNGSWLVEGRALAAWSTSQGIGLLINLGADLQRDSEHYVRMLQVVNLSYTLPLADHRLSIFAEYYARLAFASRWPGIVQADFGAAYLITDDMQLDFFTQHGLNAETTDFQLSLGLSIRLAAQSSL